jgi:hypothetical protein
VIVVQGGAPAASAPASQPQQTQTQPQTGGGGAKPEEEKSDPFGDLLEAGLGALKGLFGL